MEIMKQQWIISSNFSNVSIIKSQKSSFPERELLLHYGLWGKILTDEEYREIIKREEEI